MSTITIRSLVSRTLAAARADQPVGWVSAAARGQGRAGAFGAVVGVALAATVMPQVASAQSQAAAAGTGLDEIVVTGIRHAVESAIEVKRDNLNIVEVISAEDIGKLPDTSIAESISRLPGLTSQRSDGRASDVSIRGFDPQFATTLMNGRQQVSTGDNRNIQYDQYPSELINQVIVYKTPDAALIGQGLAGTVALQTARPLEYGREAFAINLRGQKNSDADLGSTSKNNGYRASISYIGQLMDNTLGVTAGYARLDSPIVGREVGTYDPWHANNPKVDGYNYHPDVPLDTYVTDGIKSLASMGTNRRDGLIFTLEWKPNSHLTSIADVYYTKAEENNQRRSMESHLGGYPDKKTYSNLNIQDGTLVGATVGNATPLARNFSYLTRDQILSTGWNNKWTENDWSVMADLSYQRATRDQKDYETQAQYTGGVHDTVTYNIPESSQPTVSFGRQYSDPSLVQVGPTIYGAGYSRFPHVIDELKSARLEGSHNLSGGWFSDVVVGANYDDRTKNKTQPETGLSTIGNKYYTIPSDLLQGTANLGFSGSPNPLAWDVNGVLNRFFNPVVPTTNAGYLVGKTWEVIEKVTTGYVKGDLNHELSDSVTLKGNVGVQFVHTNQSSNARIWNQATNSAIPYTDGKSFNDWLPAMNLVFALPSSQTVRFSAARELARARMDQLGAYNDFGTGQGIPGSTSGNPRLDPWRANAFDLSYEKYFANKAYVSAGVFYKELSSYIYSIKNSNYDFSAICAQVPPVANPTPGGPDVPACYQKTTGTITQPANGNGGNVRGLELAASLPGDLITDALNGFGASASVSVTNSGVQIPGTVSGIASETITLPGLSKTVWSAMVYYEKYGFSARVATRYRSDYIGEINDFAGDRALEYVRHETITDLQVGYELQSGPAKGLSFLLQVNNVGNAPFIDYAQDKRRVRDYETFGRDVFFGVNYKR